MGTGETASSATQGNLRGAAPASASIQREEMQEPHKTARDESHDLPTVVINTNTDTIKTDTIETETETTSAAALDVAVSTTNPAPKYIRVRNTNSAGDTNS